MKKVITERDIINLEKKGIQILVKTKDTLITPLAYDRIRSSKFTIVEKDITHNPQSSGLATNQQKKFQKISIGSDHTGFKVKIMISRILSEQGYQINDVGTFDEKSCDYPDFARLVAECVVAGESDCGILIDATGIPSAITANKMRGIRAATCYNSFSAKSSRAHNNSNVLVLGAKALGEETIKQIVLDWLSTEFEGGRHQKRLDKITEIEAKGR